MSTTTKFCEDLNFKTIKCLPDGKKYRFEKFITKNSKSSVFNDDLARFYSLLTSLDDGIFIPPGKKKTIVGKKFNKFSLWELKGKSFRLYGISLIEEQTPRHFLVDIGAKTDQKDDIKYIFSLLETFDKK